MNDEGNILVGLFWGTALSIPIWLAFFGWIKIISHLFLL